MALTIEFLHPTDIVESRGPKEMPNPEQTKIHARKRRTREIARINSKLIIKLP